MTGPLDAWQSRLEAHFKAFADVRRVHGLPVFALEHALDATERAVVADLLNRSLGPTSRLEQHWLVWVVYAAEQGYDYDGDEYWTTFERRTPKWRDWADRRMLRRWFGQFHDRFAGLKPSGPWASWFSIIAWPITHAILPRDLQQHLARALYELRYSLAKNLNNDPAAIGRFLASMSYDTSSRFRNFLEQEEIAGRIVLALLGGRTDAVEKSIHPLTLERIVDDLQRVNSARAWLHDARLAVERVQIKGAARKIPGSSSGTQTSGSPPPQPFIRPTLTLRRCAPAEWTAVIELPSLRPLADLAPELNSFLRRSRCTILGSPGTLPPGWLMQGDQRRVLTSWPRPGELIVRYENSPPMLAQLLRADSCITAGPRWLFRIGPDGLAHEIIGRIVRPGHRYVLVSETPMAASFGAPVTVTASGVSALRFELPNQLTSEMIAALRALSLAVAQTVQVSPVGLAARRWDGEGFAEWMEGETPCLTLNADHPVESYSVQLDAGLPLTVLGRGTTPIYLKLTNLGLGSHTLTVTAKSVDSITTAPATGYVCLNIRPSQPWIAGTTSHTGLIVIAEPAEATLDQFWEGDLNVQAFGPAHQQVKVCVELLDSSGGVLAAEQVATLPLPVINSNWSRAVATFVKRESDPWAYLSAAAGRLLVDGGALGSWRIGLHREAEPIRWVWRRGSKGTELRLVNDHEGDEQLTVQFFPFSTPATPNLLDSSQIEAGFHPDGQGGLCLARYGEKRAALVVSMPGVATSLSDLVVDPKIANVGVGDSAFEQLANLADLWSSARFIGPLAVDRRRAVITGLRRELVGRTLGSQWLAAEDRYGSSSKTYYDLQQFVAQTYAPRAFSSVLLRDLQKLRSLPLPLRIKEFDALAHRYGYVPAGASAAALQLCEWLAVGGQWDHQLKRILDLLRPVPALLRAARFLSVATPVSREHVNVRDARLRL